MKDFTDYKNKKIIIYDERSKNTIAETKIVDFNRATQTVVVDSRKFRSKCSDHVSVLIFGDDGLFEYRGTVRSMSSSSTMGIALYKGKHLENRKSVRYTVHAPATIEHLVVDEKPLPLQNGREVDIVNISSSGILIRAGDSVLGMGTTFQLKLTVDHSLTYLNATVVRITPAGDGRSDYGCQLNFQYKSSIPS